jgi:transcriptional regulator with XRE-family HTH domain
VDVDGAGLGGLLRACRKVAGLSQRELADRSGLSIRAVSNIERGRSQWPYRDSLSRLADALGLQETARAEFLAAAPRRRLALELAPGSINDGPRQLPAAVGCFTGREDELAAVNELLTTRPADTASAAVLISAIGGTAGLGKTALAIQWAHQVAAQFPDGQLYVDLRGYDPGQPVAAEEALAGFL